METSLHRRQIPISRRQNRQSRRGRRGSPQAPSPLKSPRAGEQNTIGEGSEKIPYADVSIEVKKGFVDAREIIHGDDAVLPAKDGGDRGEAEPVNQPRLGNEPDTSEKKYRSGMKAARQAQCAANAETHRNRMKSVTKIELSILQRIDHIESGKPKEHGETEQERRC